jgi:hypothetical protein
LTGALYSIILYYHNLEYLNMAKAHITLKDGAKVTIEGSQEEVAALITRFEEGAPRRAKKRSSSDRTQHQSKSRPTPLNLISELIDGGFFKKPKELGAIKLALEEQGHFYPVTTLSPSLLRLVRKKELRRIKDKKRWLYVG